MSITTQAADKDGVDPKCTATIQSLSEKSERVSSLSLSDRIQLINELIQACQDNAWASTGDWLAKEAVLVGKAAEKDIKSGSMTDDARLAAADSRNSFSISVIAYLDTLKKALEYEYDQEQQKGGTKPELLAKVREEVTPEGSVTVHGPCALPLIMGHQFEVWCKPKTKDDDKETADNFTKSDNVKGKEGGIALVLGAGNQSALSLIDTLQCFFLHPRKPVFIKHHPLRPFLYDPYAIILEPLMRRGYVDHILDQGSVQHIQKSLLSNKHVNHVHVTGAYSTAKAIQSSLVSERQDITEEMSNSLVTSELGCATPFIFSPGTYTEKELRNAAKMVTTGKKTAGGTLCLAAQAVVLPEHWPQKDTFRQYLLEELNATPTDPCYYPGSCERCDGIVNHYKELEKKDGRSRVKTASDAPFVIKDPEVAKGKNTQVSVVECGTFGKDGYDGFGLTNEAFGPILAILELPITSSKIDSDESYMLNTAIPFVNNKDNIFGTLSGTIICPDSMDKSTVAKAAASMKYGTVAINAWNLLGYLSMVRGGVWCGHPSDKCGQSGYGYVGNQYCIPDIEKTVVYGPPLSTAPIIDKRNPPPAIALDALHQFFLSKSKLEAFLNVTTLLVIRLVSSFLPSWIKGNRPYGAPI